MPAIRRALRSSSVDATRADRDPLFNQSVEKAFAVLAAYSGERRALNLAEISAAARMTTSSAQRCVHTLVRLGYLRRDEQLRRWVLTARTLDLGYPYLAGHRVIEQATMHLVDLNQSCGESVSLSERDGTDMVFVARFPSHKRFIIHMPVGRRLPMYCTAAGRAYLSALPDDEVREILRQSPLRAFTPHTLTDPSRILDIVNEARELGYAWASQECYRGDLTIGAPILGAHGQPVAAVNVSGPTSRWTLEELRQRLAPLLIETARAASGTVGASRRG
ncbi:MAG: helix-turn-helix domain-containing protein [Proteobacteria bacterium]|nr:helix-turn-helix domain-containing protein [Pseudomonadota bacterium]